MPKVAYRPYNLSASELFSGEGVLCETCMTPYVATSDVVFYKRNMRQFMRVDLTCNCGIVYQLDVETGGFV